MLTDVPMRYAIAARRYVNHVVYDVINNNPLIYDGVALFDAVNHGNYVAPGGGAAPSVATLGTGRAAMRSHMDIRGIQSLNIVPRFLFVGTAVETAAEQLLTSIADPAALNSNVKNPFEGKLIPVCDAEIADTNSWGLAADPGAFDTIEVTYLNGIDTPTIESKIGFETLGMDWRLYIDFGVTVLDYRGLYLNAGN
jgi:hypothetical protein